MTRLLPALVTVFAAAGAAMAQNPIGASVGVGSFGSGFRPPAPPVGLRALPQRPVYRAGYTPFYPYGYGGYGYGGYGYGFGGGFITSGYYSSYYVVPGPGLYDAPPPVAAPATPTHIVELSGQYPATLVLEFPAAARVWLDKTQVPGDPATTRTITSPVIRPGEQHTFHIRAEWDTGGKSYEYHRDVTLGPGDRSKLLVVSGNPKR
jgi:hypothetical protein